MSPFRDRCRTRPQSTTCVACLPVAVAPLWHDEHVPITCRWSTFVAGFQAVVTWQASHVPLDWIWATFLPVAVTPLWQDTQLPLTWVWSTCVTGRHENVAWQAPQDVLERMCVVLLPVARVPSWQADARFGHPGVREVGGSPLDGRVAALAVIVGRDVRGVLAAWPTVPSWQEKQLPSTWA